MACVGFSRESPSKVISGKICMVRFPTSSGRLLKFEKHRSPGTFRNHFSVCTVQTASSSAAGEQPALLQPLAPTAGVQPPRERTWGSPEPGRHLELRSTLLPWGAALRRRNTTVKQSCVQRKIKAISLNINVSPLHCDVVKGE